MSLKSSTITASSLEPSEIPISPKVDHLERNIDLYSSSEYTNFREKNSEQLNKAKLNHPIDLIATNDPLNRGLTDFLGIALPSTITEGILRGADRAKELIVTYTIYLFSTYLLPVLSSSFLRDSALRKNGLKKEDNELLDLSYENLTSDRNIKFKDKLLSAEKTENIINAKNQLIRYSSYVNSIVSFTDNWIRNFISKNVFGFIGFVGTENQLSDSDRKSNTCFYENNKPFLFGGGLAASLIGTTFFTKMHSNSVSSLNNSNNSSPFKIDNDFDISAKNVGKNLLVANYLTGNAIGVLTSSRSPNEFFESLFRIGAWLPMIIKGDNFIGKRLAKPIEEQNNIKLTDKSGNTLCLTDVLSKNPTERQEEALKSFRTNYIKSLLANAAIIGVGLSVISTLFTNVRISFGYGKN